MLLSRCSLWRRVPHIHNVVKRRAHTAPKTPEALQAQGPARTRFAPSPTGDLHLGSLRTALFNYLIAKATGGQFLLRIEDTDQKRTVPGAEERLYNDLRWAGIEWDEGPMKGGPYGPYKQSERTAHYRKHATELLESGSAYRCFCSQERLRTLAEHKSKLGLPPDYDRTCAHIPKWESDDRASSGESHVIRLKVPERYPLYEDLVYGIVKQRKPPVTALAKAQSFEDPILIKTDGFPTYHLANVVDDHLMKITHVVRGTEWMSSTPKHLAMYEAFGWTPPKFAHVGLLVDLKKQKLSKRTGSIDIASYRNSGVFPEALANFVALLGWSHIGRNDVMGLQELIKNFTLKFTKGDATVSFEKLSYLQRRHAVRYAGTKSDPPVDGGPQLLEDLVVEPILAELGKRSLPFYQTIPGQKRRDYVRAIFNADVANYTFPAQFVDRNNYFFDAPNTVDLGQHSIKDEKLTKVPPETPGEQPSEILSTIKEALKDMNGDATSWTRQSLHEAVDNVADFWTASTIEAMHTNGQEEAIASNTDGATAQTDLSVSIKKAWKRLILTYVRWAVVCRKDGPDTTDTMRLLGRDEVLARFETAVAALRVDNV